MSDVGASSARLRSSAAAASLLFERCRRRPALSGVGSNRSAARFCSNWSDTSALRLAAAPCGRRRRAGFAPQNAIAQRRGQRRQPIEADRHAADEHVEEEQAARRQHQQVPNVLAAGGRRQVVAKGVGLEQFGQLFRRLSVVRRVDDLPGSPCLGTDGRERRQQRLFVSRSRNSSE